MANSTAVNTQVTDTVSQANVMTLGESPAMAISLLYQSVAQALGNTANNASVLQQQGSTVTMAVAGTACAIIFAQKPTS